MVLGMAHIQTDTVLERRSIAVPVASANIMSDPLFERGAGRVCDGHPDIGCDALFQRQALCLGLLNFRYLDRIVADVNWFVVGSVVFSGVWIRSATIETDLRAEVVRKSGIQAVTEAVFYGDDTGIRV